MSSPARRLSRHTVANTVHGAIVTTVIIIINGVLFRHLGVSFGPFTLVWASMVRFDFFEDSLGSFIVRSVASLRSPDKITDTHEDRAKDVGAATALYALLALISAAILFVALLLVLHDQPWRIQGAALGAVGLTISMVARPLSKALEGREAYVTLRTVQSGAALLSLLLVGLVVAWGGDLVVSLLVAVVAVQVVTASVMAALLSRTLSLRSFLPPADTVRRWSYIISFIRPLLLAKASAIASYRLDLWIVQGFVGPAGTALYAVGETVASLAAQTIEVFKAILPVSVRDASRGPEWLRGFMIGTTKMTASVVGLVVVLLLVSTGPVIQIWFGSVSETSVWVARVLLCFYALTGFRSSAQTILVGRDQFHRLEKPFLVAGAVNIIASLFLTLVFGTVGPALGTLIAGVILLLTNILISESELGIARWSMIRQVVLPGLLSLSVAVAAGLVIPPLESPLIEIAVRSAVSLIAFLSTGWYVVLSSSDRTVLGTWLSHRVER